MKYFYVSNGHDQKKIFLNYHILAVPRQREQWVEIKYHEQNVLEIV